MRNADTIAATMLTVVDAMIADAGNRWDDEPHKGALVAWSAIQTAAGATTRELDARVFQAIRHFATGTPNYSPV